ncbi:FMN-binding negative transcriptional regulator [Streptomyces sp. NEAU-sy36]|uniref:FMN-binding negative transcriptional regulator n=1 Tax=unclassified Streptomyces TaxID=2593676 RepID=UPI0015D64FB1|nr:MULTISPECIES: FMN-binding negative transcriptional regulator [unclassified Streptomyces]QLJ02818.1 FMN-binding negative transcriptional regulator [Streptomyces sp. NEAU-sy36]
MLVQPWDAGTAEEGLELARAHGFGQLVAAGRGRDVPVVVPTQFVVEHGADGTEILLHLARANPVWAAIEENSLVVLSVAGDWAYVPAAWKAVDDEDPAWGIPTTYYAAAQLTGTARVVVDPEGKAEILRRQIAREETDGGASMVDPAEHGRRLAGILGLRIRVEQVVAKFKYGGNADAAHRARVAELLARRAGPGDAVARRRLLERAPD